MINCLILNFAFYFFGLILQGIPSDSDSLKLKEDHLDLADTLILDKRNDFIKQSLFTNSSDSTLLEMALETLAFSEYLGYQKGALMANERLGLIYQYRFSNPYIALDYYLQALSISESNPAVREFKWGIQGNIGTIYYEQEEYEKGLEIFKEVASNSRKLELTAILNIGNIYGSLQRNDSAIFYFEKALEYEQIKSNPVQLANLYSNLSLIYVQSNQLENALETAERSLALVDSLEIDFVKPTAYANSAMAFLENGDLNKAEQMALMSLEYSQKQENLFIQKSAWGTLADIYEARGKYKESLDAYKNFATLKDSLTNQNRRVEVSRKQMAFDFEKERAQARVDIERQKLVRNFTLGLAILIGLILLIGGYLYKRRRDSLAKIKDAEFKTLVSETELKALRSQMNPHFIFNSLNSIGDYILKNDSDSAQDYLSKFGKLIRIVLENSGQEEITLREDVEFLELYLQIESKRQPHRFSYSIRFAENIDLDAILVPPMLLQPFIENAIWHAFPEKGERGRIEISFEVKGENLFCTVEDNGIGRAKSSNSIGKKSMGVAITENRIKILNEKSGTQGSLQIIDKTLDSGTKVEIILPLHLAY